MFKSHIKKRVMFNDPLVSYPDGLMAISEDITTEMLAEAYSFGIFPWPYEETPLLWFSPDQRGVLDFDELVIAKSLQKLLRKSQWRFTLNSAFDQVIDGCAQAYRPKQQGTWITSQMKSAYLKFHQAGYAHSGEVWEGDELVGGIYGVYIGGVFSGESMFYRRSNASKFAFVKMVEVLQAAGLTWMDTQTVSPNVKNFGAKYISKDEFQKRLEMAHQNLSKFKALAPG